MRIVNKLPHVFTQVCLCETQRANMQTKVKIVHYLDTGNKVSIMDDKSTYIQYKSSYVFCIIYDFHLEAKMASKSSYNVFGLDL